MRELLHKKTGGNNASLHQRDFSNSSFVRPTAQSIMAMNKKVAESENDNSIATKNNQEMEQAPENSVVNETEKEKETANKITNTNEVATAPTVKIGKVNASSTPSGMPDRLPPRVDTDVNVNVSGHSVPMNNIEFSVESGSAANGTATINGTSKHVQNSSGTLKLKGTTQTSPGSAGKLTVVAKQGGTVIARSNTFSVSAIIQNYSVALNSIKSSGNDRGIVVDTFWKSDSGNLADLDETKASEQVRTSSKKGVFSTVGTTPSNSGYLGSQQNPPHTDTHTIGPVSALNSLKGNGSFTFDQVFTLWDKRTGAKDIPIRNSGFNITQEMTYDASSKATTLKTSKKGSSANAKGFSSSAGSGNANHSQVL